MKLLYLLSLCMMMVVMAGLGSASDYLGHKQNTAFNLTILSNNATSCNLSYIQYPNDVSHIFNQPLVKNGQTFHLNIPSGNYSQLGTICHGITCTDGVSVETGSVCRNITPSGFVGTIGFFFIYIIIILAVFAVGFYLENNWIMFFASILVLLFGFFIIKNGIDIIKDTQTTWAIGIIVWALGIIFMFLSVEEQLKEWG